MLTDSQKTSLDELGDNPIQKSLEKHREKLETVSNRTLDLLEEDSETATVDQRVKIYDTTRKHLNVIDGREGSTINNNLIILPNELIKDHQEELKEAISEKMKNKEFSSTSPKKKSPKTITVSE